jgi:hypothetical protein
MEWLIYVAVIAIVVGDMIAAQHINNIRKGLDLTQEEGRARDKKLRLVIGAALAYSLVICAILIFYVKPNFTS